MKKYSGLLLVGVLCLNTAVAFAAETASEGISTANIEFQTNEEATTPKNPEKPSEERPEDGDPHDLDNPGTGNSGPLSIDFVSNIQFGNQSIDTGRKTYQAMNLNPYVQVSDKRGTGDGWHLNASISNFSDGAKTLPAVVMSMKNSVLKKADISNNFGTPEASNVVFAESNVSYPVVNAAKDAGLGTWLNVWEAGSTGSRMDEETPAPAKLNPNVTLEVPAGSAREGAYTANITWMLVNAPK